jgi:hypothetical protein
MHLILIEKVERGVIKKGEVKFNLQLLSDLSLQFEHGRSINSCLATRMNFRFWAHYLKKPSTPLL